jgi:hypothetical protein
MDSQAGGFKMPTLSRVSEQHRKKLAGHVERLPLLADEIGRSPWKEVGPRLADELDFLTSTLVPHMQTVEEAVHSELDRLLSCRLGMEPLEREHKEIRRLIDLWSAMTTRRGAVEPSHGEVIELNRIVVKLYSILRIHLREEAMYVPILEHNLSTDQAEAIALAMEHAARIEL